MLTDDQDALLTGPRKGLRDLNGAWVLFCELHQVDPVNSGAEANAAYMSWVRSPEVQARAQQQAPHIFTASAFGPPHIRAHHAWGAWLCEDLARLIEAQRQEVAP